MAEAKHPEFAAHLLSARKRSGKSQERAAAEVGTSRRHWIRWENGENLPSPDYMQRIADALPDFTPVEEAGAPSPFRGKAA